MSDHEFLNLHTCIGLIQNWPFFKVHPNDNSCRHNYILPILRSLTVIQNQGHKEGNFRAISEKASEYLLVPKN